MKKISIKIFDLRVVSLFLILFLLVGVSATVNSFEIKRDSREPLTPLPHVLVGYAFYDELGVPADGAQVMVRNLRSGDEVFSEVYSDGFYSVSVVSDPPESDWLDGDSVRVSFEGVGDFEFWVGSVVVVLDFDVEPQVVPDVFLVEGVGCSFDLCAGWNLITVPVDMTGWSAEDLGQAIDGCNYICKFNAETQTYTSHVVGSTHYDFQIVSCCGYFIYLLADTTLTFTGSVITNVSVPLQNGWNLIGWYHDCPTTAESLGQNIDGCNYICKFNAETQTYTSHVVGSTHYDFQITAGMAFFVYTTESSVWHGEG